MSKYLQSKDALYLKLANILKFKTQFWAVLVGVWMERCRDIHTTSTSVFSYRKHFRYCLRKIQRSVSPNSDPRDQQQPFCLNVHQNVGFRMSTSECRIRFPTYEP